jgi:hypothetical protein
VLNKWSSDTVFGLLFLNDLVAQSGFYMFVCKFRIINLLSMLCAFRVHNKILKMFI